MKGSTLVAVAAFETRHLVLLAPTTMAFNALTGLRSSATWAPGYPRSGRLPPSCSQEFICGDIVGRSVHYHHSIPSGAPKPTKFHRADQKSHLPGVCSSIVILRCPSGPGSGLATTQLDINHFPFKTASLPSRTQVFFMPHPELRYVPILRP